MTTKAGTKETAWTDTNDSGNQFVDQSFVTSKGNTIQILVCESLGEN